MCNLIWSPIPSCKVMITIHEKIRPPLLQPQLFWPSHLRTLSAQTHCLFVSEGYPADSGTCSLERARTHAGCGAPCQHQGHCLFFMFSRVLPCGSTSAQWINSQTRTHSPPQRKGKGDSKDVALCTCACVCVYVCVRALQTVSSLLSPSLFEPVTACAEDFFRPHPQNYRPVT